MYFKKNDGEEHKLHRKRQATLHMICLFCIDQKCDAHQCLYTVRSVTDNNNHFISIYLSLLKQQKKKLAGWLNYLIYIDENFWMTWNNFLDVGYFILLYLDMRASQLRFAVADS